MSQRNRAHDQRAVQIQSDSPEIAVDGEKLSDPHRYRDSAVADGESSLLTEILRRFFDRSGRVLVSTGWADITTRFHRMNGECAALCTGDLFL